MRSGMAEFRSHLESYDSQLADVKRSAGDATHEVSQVNDKVLLLRRNVTTLRGSLSALQLDHTDTANSLDLLATVSLHSQHLSISLCVSIYYVYMTLYMIVSKCSLSNRMHIHTCTCTCGLACSSGVL